jgi:hypothetical protein
MEFHLLDSRREARYADYVSRHSDTTFFHELGWKRAVERAFGHESPYLLAEKDREIVGVIPFFQSTALLAVACSLAFPMPLTVEF